LGVEGLEQAAEVGSVILNHVGKSMARGLEPAHTCTVRWATLARLLLPLVVLGSCSSLGLGGSAEVLNTPFPAALVDLQVRSHSCGGAPPYCTIRFTLRVTNPTDRDANVMQCHIVAPSGGAQPVSVDVGIGFPAGTFVPAGGTSEAEGQQQVHVTYEEAVNLGKGTVTCTGLDWHGNAPI